MKKRYWIAILCTVLALVLTVVAASADEGDVYGRMTDEADLHDGDRIILVSDDGSYYQAMATDFSGMQVTVTENTITEQDGMLALTLTETEGGWLLAANDGYLAVDGDALTIVSDSADAAVWSISIAPDGTATVSCADGNIVFAEQDGEYHFFCGEGGNEIAIYNATFEPEHHAFGDDLWWSFANGKLTIGGSGEMPHFGSRSQPWNQLLSNITEVEIQDDVTSIGTDAFYSCTRLQSVTIGNGVTSIGYEAFYECRGLQSVIIGNSVTSIGDGAFYNCTGLTSVTMPDSVTSIGGDAFYNCTGLQSVTIPDSVTSIGNYAFYYCRRLQSITIGNGVTSIGGWTFYNTGWWNAQSDGVVYLDYILLGVKGTCGQIIRIQEGTRLIAGYAFYSQEQISKVTIPDSVTSIGDYAFYGCTGLQSITIGNSVTSIGQEAFQNCTGLTEITIPDSVTSIGYSAFSGCTGLTEITIPDSVTSIGFGAFSNCTGLTEITIPDSVTSIGGHAFSGCTGLTSVTMPCSASIDTGAFHSCTHITSVYLTKGNGTMIDYIGGYDYNCGYKYQWTPWYQSRENIITVTLDDGIQNIGSYAFYNCTGLTEITIPDSVTSIGYSAFYGCTGLTEITIPDSVTSIDGSAFYGCTGLQSVTIGSGVTSIGKYAFYGCTGLTSVTMPCSASIDTGAFHSCTHIMSVYLTKGTGIMADYSSPNYTNTPWYFSRENAITVTLDDGIQNIGSEAFRGCTGLTSITIPDSVTSIGNYAFYGCTGLMSVTIGSGVTSIGYSAFYGCTGLTDVYYHGTRRTRNGITIGHYNGPLANAQWHYLTPNAIEWKTLPDKLQYQEGESLDIAGGVFSAYYDYEIVEEETLTADMITGFDNTTAGEQTLTVTFEGKTLTYTVTVTHASGEPVRENEVAASCTEAGSYDEVVYCSGCGEELSREHFDIPALGHDLVHHDAKEPTCTEIGWEAYDACSRCDYTTYKEISALGHTPGEPVIENEVEPTYTAEGHYDEVVYCTRCGAELERYTHTIERLPFEGTVEWNPEDVKFKGTTAYVIANGSVQTPRFTVKNSADGSLIDTAFYDYEYVENTNAGTGYVIVTFKGDYSGTAQGWFKIYLPATTKTNVENVAEGIRITWEPVEDAAGYVIYRRAWSSTTNGWTTFERWNNTTDTTYIDGADANHKVYAGSRYQYGVKAYFARRTDPVSGATIGGNVGDNFNLGEVGPLKTTVRITTRVLNSVTAGSKEMTVKWTPSKNFTGYQIKYATDKNFTKNVVAIKITDPKTAQTVIKNLKKGTTYYVTIRSYHEFNGMTYFGEWSNVKSCKVK